MSDLQFKTDWIDYPDADIEDADVTAQLQILAGGRCLTRNEDAWSGSVQDSIAVSLYPLAEWLAASWWRLNHEPLPESGGVSTDWRMSHEIAAANAGYVWPSVTFATDDDAMQVWARASAASGLVSGKYLVGTDGPVLVPLDKFQASVSGLIGKVLDKLSQPRKQKTELAELWQWVQAEMADPKEAALRRLEARMGYDPAECPERLLKQAADFASRLGEGVLAELAAAHARRDADADVKGMAGLLDAKGLTGSLQVPDSSLSSVSVLADQEAPWARAVESARNLRRALGMQGEPIEDPVLYGLLGLRTEDVLAWSPAGRAKAALARPEKQGRMSYVSRKPHPVAKRFEFARFIADAMQGAQSGPSSWLVATDLATARQKFQRAFAAEFLCPIDSLVEYMDGDLSETSQEKAAERFKVSERAVSSLLMNNDYITPEYPAEGLPYRTGRRQPPLAA